MMKNYKYYLLLILFGFNIRATSQVVTESLISKMDVNPQYVLWDGNTTMLMGFTKLLGTPIGLPSPTLIFNEGDSVELSLTNFSQPASHTIHLHGLDVNQENDGVPHLSFYVQHDSTRTYEFIAPHAGTYLYHCHVVSTLHVQAGMYGMIIIRPPDGSNTTWDGGYSFDVECAWLFSEIDTNWHTNSVINNPWDPQDSTQLVLDYNPQYFLINGLSEHQLSDPTTSINAPANSVVYTRLVNLGYYGNRLIFPPSLNAQIVDSDGRPLPSAVDSDTVLVMPGERYGVLLYPTTEMTDVVSVEYFDLNTQQVINTQESPVTISGFLDQAINSEETIGVFPNPANDEVLIKINSSNETIRQLTLLDLSGKIVFEKSYQFNNQVSEKLSTEDLKNGVYIVVVRTDTKQLKKKIIIQH